MLVEEGGASPGVLDRWSSTPLQEAQRVHCRPVVDFLLPLTPSQARPSPPGARDHLTPCLAHRLRQSRMPCRANQAPVQYATVGGAARDGCLGDGCLPAIQSPTVCICEGCCSTQCPASEQPMCLQ